MVAGKLRQLYRLIGPRFFIEQALHVLPLALIEIATLLVLRWLLLLLYGLAGPAGVDHYWPAGLRTGTALVDGLALAAAVALFLAARFVAVGQISRSIFRRTMAEQVRLTRDLLRTYLGQSHDLQVVSDRSEQRQTMFVSATALVHQLLLPAAQLMVDGLVMLALVAVLLWLEPVATLAAVGWMAAVYGLQTAWARRHALRHGARRWDALNQMRRISDGALGDAGAIKLSASENAFSTMFDQAATAHANAVADEHALGQWPAHMRELVLVSAIGVLTVALLLQGRSGATLVQALTIFAAASVRLLPALQRSATMAQKVNAHAPDLARIIADRNLPVEVLEPRPEQPVEPLFARSIALDAVSLTRPGAATPIFAGVSLTIRPGDRIEISGASGAGKSTLVLLLCGLIKPTAGQVLIDGEGGDVIGRMRRARVALVAQHPFLFAAPPIDNLAFPHPIETLDRARAERVIAELGLPFSLDDDRAETVQRLSGGERQRLAIARAICGAPDLLILDEATSQLDPETERRTCACIQRECADATIVMVAHRPLPALLDAHRYRLDHGRLSAIGCAPAARG
ncbi:ATP-binding cassette domain-containing protein [Sphingomonas sanxanigenens]|uniref:ABC transporter ATP-binding protein n=1 Tax=Sphingomonas sanxanigenens DSM 19645 = NX02 TaxID=1123269 RepID=W0A5Q3_9SPHN|nr:ATP-binding cassette domain-containing protein [Sphingomonas sanxanigenens]AHE51812.1 hypothetical protein NX02_00215 [Sphingomonas sanxanigenens DSM 19645 = NX02]